MKTSTSSEAAGAQEILESLAARTGEFLSGLQEAGSPLDLESLGELLDERERLLASLGYGAGEAAVAPESGEARERSRTAAERLAELDADLLGRIDEDLVLRRELLAQLGRTRRTLAGYKGGRRGRGTPSRLDTRR